MSTHNYRKIWSDTFGPIIKGFHVHHIVPKCEGGKDVLGNLIALHPDDHELIHLLRGDIRAASGVYNMRNGHSEETKKKMSINNRMHKAEAKKAMSELMTNRVMLNNHSNKLKGDSRTAKQKEAAKAHSDKMKGKTWTIQRRCKIMFTKAKTVREKLYGK